MDKKLPIVYLIGFMGAGKTTYGKASARKAGWLFKDLDTLIESQASLTIPEIFSQKGESHFRALERQVLENTQNMEGGPYLIACGGGTPCYSDNMDWMNVHGTTVYLDTPEEILLGRLRAMRAYRPMLNQVPDKELGNFIHNLLLNRTPFYRKAKYILSGEELNEKSLTQLLQDIYPGNSPRFGKIQHET